MQRVDQSVDYRAEGWNDFFTRKAASWRDKDYRLLQKMFRIETLTGSLLDVGCGLGDGLRLMQQNMSRISSFAGTDFSDEAIRKNSENDSLTGIDFFVHDIHQPLERTYDNIICLQTLEHLPEPAVAMNNLIAATDGVLIVASPYKNRRPDENHLWSFDETDFAGESVTFLDKRNRNIFWVLDKRSKGQRLRRRGVPLFVDKLLARM